MSLDQEKAQIPSSPIPKWLIWAIARDNNYQPTLLGHIALSGALISIALISWIIMFVISTAWEKEWIFKPERITVEQLESATAKLSPTIYERNRMISQFQEIERLADKHANIMGFFYKQYYISLATMGACAALAIVSLFFISKVGWERVNNALINIFIVTSGIVIFYGNISLIFQQKDNLEASQKIYVNYLGLRNEVLSYLATGETIANESITPAKFIHYVDRELKSISFVRLGFDPKSIPDFSKQFYDKPATSK
ncbi:hypothetical protein APA_4131 [Pseudanabaena sp. lw0831]|uniref:hypothetical protein n=1 Tax=Pseudanabaena sp. lw0831 TaxID=1357935 RepID=UPI001915420E|nr:hypothetical protein [Pseudanabaena sp. lw0831]GBO55925.1 hypothetical protein APA_4131 [Pseudanabaena sp. lw0831]